MIYLKSIVVGLLAVAVAMLLLPLIGIPLYTAIARPKAIVGWDPISALKSPEIWIADSVVFAAAFYWKFHKLKS